MPKSTRKLVSDLSLDLTNYRTPPQRSESAALKAMIASDGRAFWALLESLLEDGILPTENVIVLDKNGKFVVKEGNRRVAALKLILGQISSSGIVMPPAIQAKLRALDKVAKRAFQEVPCAIFEESEAEIVDRIVSLTHGKDARAGRSQWNAVAKARHNRDHMRVPEPGLDLLEAYIKHGTNLTDEQKASWGAEYPLTVLNEALQKLAPRLNLEKAGDIVSRYPKRFNATEVKGLEGLLRDIGIGYRKFAYFRDPKTDPFVAYGFPAPQATGGEAPSKADERSDETAMTGGGSSGRDRSRSSQASKGGAGAARGDKKAKAIAITDPLSVRKRLDEMLVAGKRREKVETLRSEAKALDIRRTPLAFCFVLRSMFELSAKAYCNDHQLPTKDKKGNDLKLARVLSNIIDHLVDKADLNEQVKMKQELHGARVELNESHRLLSVTSMNQLVHHLEFSAAPRDICRTFHNVSRLLELMNA